MGGMTTGEILLNLTIEYRESVESRSAWAGYGGKPAGREPQEIAADYETALKALLTAP